ncbi:protein-disulfide reductase [Ranunculus cassubicifolius]
MANNVSDKDQHDLQSLLSSPSRDFLVRNNGDQVKISDLSGKTIGLYFSASWCGPCRRFTPQLIEVYNELSSKKDFEVVFVSADRDEESFKGYFSKMPWLALPLSDSESRGSLDELFSVNGIPHLVILNASGKILTDDGVSTISNYGAEAHPFTPERIKELEEEEERAKKDQTLSSVLASSSRNFLISNDGNQVPVSELVGKNVLLYFSAHWCPPCRAFLPKLIETYSEIKEKHDAFEVIFISSDRDEPAFQDFFSSMPWLALPYGDERKASLSKTFKVQGIPTVVALGPTGKTVSQDCRSLIMMHGANAYPFTNERLKEIEVEVDEMAKAWPEKVKHASHGEHELVLSRRMNYVCDGCEESGVGWSYFCKECDFDLHPKCAFKEETKDEKKMEEDTSEEAFKQGVVCDGDVCYKA